MAEPLDPEAFSKQLLETVSAQLAAQFAKTKSVLDQQTARIEEENRLLTARLNGSPVAPPLVTAENLALLQTINANPKLREAVLALAKGFSAAPAPSGG